MCSASAPASAAALSSEELIRVERDCSAHNYHPIPIVFSKGEGSQILDPEEYLTSMFEYEMMLPMNTGAEGVETAIKFARKWGHDKKRKIPKNEALIVSCCGCV